MDLRRVQERQQARDEGCVEGAEEDRFEGAVGQEALRGGHLLRRQREHASEDPLHHGGGLAGSLREEHVHPSDGRRTGELRRARLRGAQRLEGQGEGVQEARPELGDGRRVQPHREDAGDHQHVVRRRDEEGYVLLHELPAAAQGHRFDALLGQHEREGRDGHLLRSVRNRQDHAFDRSATTSTAGTTTAYSTSRAAATPRSSTSRRRTSRTSGTPSAATPCWRT